MQNNIATKEFLNLQKLNSDMQLMISEIQNMKATLSTYGMTKLSTAVDITDSNAYALSAVEKNSSVSGTLANKIADVNNRLGCMMYVTRVHVNASPSVSTIDLTDLMNSWGSSGSGMHFLVFGGHFGNNIRTCIALMYASPVYDGWIHYAHNNAGPKVTFNKGVVSFSFDDTGANDGYYSIYKMS